MKGIVREIVYFKCGVYQKFLYLIIYICLLSPSNLDFLFLYTVAKITGS